MPTRPWRIALTLALPLALSCASWIFDLAILTNASSRDLEGDYYLTTFVGAISFVVTGPLTGLLLGPYVRDDSIRAWAFSGLFFLVSLPVLSFEVLAYSSSVLPLFMIFGPWTDRNMLMFYGEAALLALATYVVCSVAMYWQVRRGFLPGLLTAVLLSAGSFAILVFRFLHG